MSHTLARRQGARLSRTEWNGAERSAARCSIVERSEAKLMHDTCSMSSRLSRACLRLGCLTKPWPLRIPQHSPHDRGLRSFGRPISAQVMTTAYTATQIS
eukprot:365357-Chlamydomonas_euryale.AAC.5